MMMMSHILNMRAAYRNYSVFQNNLHGLVGHFCLYRATLCVSAVFAVVQCLSVHPSVTLVDCIQRAEDIVRLLSRPGSPVILVFLYPSADTQFQGEPLQRGRKIRRGEILRSSSETAVISETVRDRPMVAMER